MIYEARRRLALLRDASRTPGSLDAADHANVAFDHLYSGFGLHQMRHSAWSPPVARYPGTSSACTLNRNPSTWEVPHPFDVPNSSLSMGCVFFGQSSSVRDERRQSEEMVAHTGWCRRDLARPKAPYELRSDLISGAAWYASTLKSSAIS